MSVTSEIPTIWTTGWTDVFDTGTWRAALPVHAWRPSPCHAACPVDADSPVWIKQLADGATKDAWLTIVERNPFPAVTGRVCHHPCEGQCNRAALDGAVSVNGLEHFLGDLALEEGWELPAAPETNGRRVAVVGGGPAGLSCAYHLRRQGVGVTVYEAREELGGLLRWGIPEYRLPKEILRKEIERLLALGIETRTGTPVTGEQDLAGLEAECDAVFVAVGAQRAKRLAHLQGSRVLDGLSFLAAVAEGRAPTLGSRVAVVGGGSAAMDVARTARRLGSEVSVVCLEEKEAMPAQTLEVDEALEEGVVLFAGALVQAAEERSDGLRLDCVEVELDQTALPALKPLLKPGTEFSLEADDLLVSIGQDADADGLAGALFGDEGVIAVGPDFSTTRPSVFAGGDVAGLERFVSVAIGQGRDAAAGIRARLGVGSPAPEKAALAEVVAEDQVNLYYFSESARQERNRLAAEERLQGFREAAEVLSAGTAADEAARCLSCGTCIECDNCVVFCPDLAVKKDDNDPQHYRVLEQYCKGCGLCVIECPRGVVRPKAEVR
jgi:NADPH-dependent glutamate synthase beta subunit-like oxidoreductase